MRLFKLRQQVELTLYKTIEVKAATLNKAARKAAKIVMDHPITGVLPGWKQDEAKANIVCGCGAGISTSSDDVTSWCFVCHQDREDES